MSYRPLRQSIGIGAKKVWVSREVDMDGASFFCRKLTIYILAHRSLIALANRRKASVTLFFPTQRRSMTASVASSLLLPPPPTEGTVGESLMAELASSNRISFDDCGLDTSLLSLLWHTPPIPIVYPAWRMISACSLLHAALAFALAESEATTGTTTIPPLR